MTHARLARPSILAFFLAQLASSIPVSAQEPPGEQPETPSNVAPPTPEAVPSGHEATTTTSTEPPIELETTPAPRPAIGTVVGNRQNDVIVDIGGNAGLSLGARVELYEVTPVDLGDGELAYSRESIAIGEVTALTGRRALVRLGTNEAVPVGAQASLVEFAVPTTSVVHPPRIGGVWEISGDARVFAVNSALGGGFLGGGFIGYRGERPFFVRLRVDPSGFTVHRTSRSQPFANAASAGAMVMAGFDHRYFGFGAGFGITRAMPLSGSFCTSNGTSVGCETRTEGAHAGFSFGIHARVGVQDGLSVSVDTSFTTVRARSEMSLIDVRAHIPVAQRLGFVLRGGSGFLVTGASWVDLGARMRARGDGGAGSLYVTPFLGWARLTDRSEGQFFRYDDTQEFTDDGIRAEGKRSGASAGITVEYRL